MDSQEIRRQAEIKRGQEVSAKHQRQLQIDQWEADRKIKVYYLGSHKTRYRKNEICVRVHPAECSVMTTETFAAASLKPSELFWDDAISFPSEELIAKIFLSLEFNRD